MWMDAFTSNSISVPVGTPDRSWIRTRCGRRSRKICSHQNRPLIFKNAMSSGICCIEPE